MSAWAIVGIVVGVIVVLIAIGWIRQIVGAKKFEREWAKMTPEQQRRVQEQGRKLEIV